MAKPKSKLDEDCRKTAIAFLTEIPLNFREACIIFDKKILRSSAEALNVPNSSKFSQKVISRDSLLVDAGDSQPKDSLLSSPTAYNRSISSYDSSSSFHMSMTETDSNVRHSVDLEHIPSRSVKFRKSVKKMKYLTNTMLHTNRIFLVEPFHKTPCAIYSILPFLKDGEKHKSHPSTSKLQNAPLDKSEQHEKVKISETLLLSAPDEVTSYQQLLDPSHPEPVVDLDTAEWLSGKHRTVLTFNSYMISIIGYTKPSELKRDLNLKFKETFPKVNLTLSKLRSLERQMHRASRVSNVSGSVLSYAKSYFERLVFSCIVNKTNRHHVAAVCLLLSAKIHGDLKPDEVSQLVSLLDHSFKSTKSCILHYEFAVFAALKFSIMLPVCTRPVSGDPP